MSSPFAKAGSDGSVVGVGSATCRTSTWCGCGSRLSASLARMCRSSTSRTRSARRATVAGPGRRGRPVPLGRESAATRRRGAARRGVSAVGATDDTRDTAVRGGRAQPGLTHSGHPDLARHVGNAVVKNDSRGHRIVKEHKDSARPIDLAVCCGDGVRGGVDGGAGAATFRSRTEHLHRTLF
jgi:hypothetical protein